MPTYQGQYLTDHLPAPPPLVMGAGLAGIADYLNNAADALDPGALSAADLSRVRNSHVKAGRKLSRYLKFHAAQFEKAARGDIRPFRAWSTIELSWLTSQRFKTLLSGRPDNPNTEGVKAIRSGLKGLHDLAKAQPLSMFTRWPLLKTLTVLGCGVAALPYANSMALAIWNRDGFSDIWKEFNQRLDYQTEIKHGPHPFETPALGKIFICQFPFPGTTRETLPEYNARMVYEKDALALAFKMAEDRAENTRLPTDYGHDAIIYIEPYQARMTAFKGVKTSEAMVNGCESNTIWVGTKTFTP